MRRYNTSIKDIVYAKANYCKKHNGQDPIFLSDWNSDYNSILIPSLEYNSTQFSDLQNYYFWTDENDYRSNIQSFFSYHFSQLISKDCFTIGSNGTSSMMLALTALREAGRKKALIFTPIYFSTLNMLDQLEFDVVEFNLSFHNNFYIDINQLENTIVKTNSDIIIITNPLFGSGVEIDIDTIKKISDVCNTHNVCLIMDYIYGGMAWKVSEPIDYIFQYQVYCAVSLTEQHVFIESISKRLFLNGAKFSLVFSSSSIMRRILRISVFMIGSMAFQQVNLVSQIYCSSSVPVLSNLITENAATANNHYRIIKTMLYDSPANISNANCGYFAIITLPKKDRKEDIAYAIDLLNRTGVLTIPHSRYLFNEDGFYSFRINLLLDYNNLIEGVTRIRNLK